MPKLNHTFTDNSSLHDIFSHQQQSFKLSSPSTAKQRIHLLNQLKQALLSHKLHLVDALNTDYGQRPVQDSVFGDILPCVMNINYTIKRLKRWMKPSKRHPGLLLAPATIRVEYQPLGVIGIMVPWNFPVMLSIGPLITAIAAGNCAMLKLSELTPHTNAVLKQLLSTVFTPSQVTVIEGEADIAIAFSQLPFDHLLFTGSSKVGRHVMRAAADNLTPVTLELGGKSPVIIGDDMPIDTAVERLIFGKCLNAGQICVAPDYVFCPEHKIEAFTQSYRQQFQAMYGDATNLSDYSHIINDNQYHKLLSLLQDAQDKGATIIAANDKTIDTNTKQLATQLVLNPTDDMLLMQQEIFGPILPVIGYQDLDQTIEYINQRPQPLALYIMSFTQQTQRKLLDTTRSGGVCINDTIAHVAADDAPFGGIGASGMGHYHGHEGFLTFSKAKTVLSRGKINPGKLIHPPYNGWIEKIMLKIFLR